LLENSLVVHVTRARAKYLSSLLAGVEELTTHRHEKRLGRVLKNLSSLSCGWFKVCKTEKPDHLAYEMELRYCIKCNTEHWFFLKRIEFEQTVFDPNEHWTWQLEEMGFFDKGHDTDRPKN
jgi:hypothetical protein